jgi:hypothetical protein
MPRFRDGSPFTRRRWTTDEAREVLAALARSSQPVTTFAEEQGLEPHGEKMDTRPTAA